MKVEVKVFGQLTDMLGAERMAVEGIADTKELLSRLTTLHPVLQDMAIAVAVDGRIVTENTPLTTASLVVLMPPFSGG